MPQSTNLNKAPYFDDFDPLKNFYRILFRPGYSIQSRELTTLQSILQNQIENLAKANFKQGSIVVPGEIIFDSQYNYVKISSFTNNLLITDFIGKKMTGISSGVVATVINATSLTDTDSPTLFVKYQNGGTSNTETTFFEGETITADSAGSPTAIVGVSGNVNPTTTNALGYGSAVTVNEGIYFINGTLVRNNTSTIILDKYINIPSYKVGFNVTEQLITPEEDFSLLDNAQGYSNYSAPGAHRFSLIVSLDKKDIDAPDQKDFVQLLLIQKGNVTSTVQTVETNIFLQDLLARRTYDESGDYIVKDFKLNLKESLNIGSNNGVYTSAQGGSDNKFIAALDPGKAYVKGHEIETTSVRYVDIDKARDYATQTDTFVTPLEGSNYTVNNLYSFPDIEEKTQNITGTGIVSTKPYQEIKLYDTHVDTAYGETTGSLDNISPESERFYILTLSSLSSPAIITIPTSYAHTGIGGSINGDIRYYKLNASLTKAFAIVTNTVSLEYNVGGSITFGGISAVISTAERISTPYVGISKTKYLKFLSGNSTSKVYDKNSSLFKLGLFGTEYFTKILCRNTLNFTAGKLITGQSSGATGIVELLLSETNELILSQVSGKFQSGETILSELTGTSTPYNFIETDNSIAYLKPSSFGSGYTSISGITITVNGTNQTSIIGSSNITLTSNQLRSIRITAAARLSLGSFDASPVISIAGSPGSGANYTAILNSSSVINYDSSYIKSFFNSTTGNPFTGDVASLQDVYQISNGATYSALENSYYITSDNLNTRPDLDLIAGDIIKVTDDAGVIRKYIVKFATKSGTTNTSRIYVYGFVLSAFNAKTIERLRSKLNGISGNTLLIPLPNKNVKTTILDPNNTNINYTVQREFLGNLDSAGTITLSVGTNEQFLSYTSDNYILANPQNGTIYDLSGAITLGGSAQSITINLGVSFANVAYKLIAPVVKSDTVPKTKTLVENQEYQITSGFSYTTIPLNYADGYKLKAVYMSSSGADATANDVNITNRFIFDGGQKDTHYDLIRLIRKPGTQVPTNKMLVVFDYFNHIGSSVNGDYFTADSYTFTDTFKFKDIPTFTSSVYGKISLRDVIDFRPRVSNYTGLDTETVLPGYNGKISANALKFTGTGSSTCELPIPGTAYYTGYQYYLNRIDALYISKAGSFKVSKGTASLNPQTPAELADGILLYYFNIPAYTFSLSDVQIKSVDNKRYTMRDIGKLEKRIDKLEYYTVLSLSEQDVFNTQVRDSLGNERFKNGILVDNFEGHNIGNTNSLDYSCAIDTQIGLLRPNYNASQTKLIEKNLNDNQRIANGYVKTGELITLPFAEQFTILNSYATKTISINPGKSSKFSGTISLDPAIDEWKDTTTAPELISNENSIFDTIQNNNSNLWGSIWNEWQILWTGSPGYGLSNSTSFNSNGNTQFNSTVDSVVKGKTRIRSRNGTQNKLSPYGVSSTSINQRVVSNAYIPYARSIAIKFVARGLEPLTRLYAFFDGIDVSSWVNPDDVTGITTPFTGIGGYSEKGFGSPIITDSNGNISGIFLVPSGYAPFQGKKLYDKENFPITFYNTSGTQRKFTTGTKTFRLTSSNTNSSSNTEVTTFTETEYVVSGALNTNNSTRTSLISRRSASNSDTVQLIGGNTVNINQSGLLDPLAQTFTVSGYEEGIFLSSIDLYFNSKTNTSGLDTDRPVSIYLTETSGGIPTRNIIPFSQVSLNSDTILRIKLTNDVGSGINLVSGETITGKTSGASGTIKSALTVSSTSTRYNLILSNHNGVNFIAGEQIQINRSPLITSTSFYIDQDCGIVEKIRVTNFGSGYLSNATTISINGDNGGVFGVPATASVKIYNGKIYNINLTNNGSGYYTAPTVTLTGGDGLATAESVIRITNPSVKMGISTSSDASIKTNFKFASPVYLKNNTTYSLIVNSSSSDYTLYSSRVGEKLLNSIIVAANSPNVGSLFKSQNASNWSEDTLEDLKFTANRCVFDTTVIPTIEFVNTDINFVTLPSNPITIDDTLGTSTLFGANQKIVRINHPNNGMKEGDTVILSDITGIGSPENIFGLPVSLLNGIHNISNVGIDDYCVAIDTTLWNSANVAITGSGTGGGNYVRATTNKLYQIIQSQVSALSFASSSVSHSIKTVYGKSIDSTTTNEYLLADSEEISPGDNYYFSNSRVIASNNNEIYRGLTVTTQKRSILYSLTLGSSVDNVSPVIDTNRTNIIIIGSRIDNPIGSENRFGTLSQTLTVPTSSAYTITTTPKTVKSVIITYGSSSGGNFTNTVDSNTRLTQSSTGASGQIVNVDIANNKIKLIDVIGDFVTGSNIVQSSVTAIPNNIIIKSGIIIGWDSGTGALKIKLTSPTSFVAGDIINDNDAGGSPVTTRIVSNITTTGGFLYIPETNPFGSSSISKYVTKEVILDTPGTALNATITANLFNNQDIKVFYKIKPDGSTQDINKISWEAFNGTGYADNSSNIIPSNLNALSPTVEDLDSYFEYKYTTINLKPFKAFAIKIVFASSNPALAPRLEDLRVIANS